MQYNSTDSISEQMDRDFSRNVWCIAGLLFDAINMKQAVESIVLAAAEKKSYFLSTPNLNFLCAAQSDTDFRQSVLNSDLSVADGMPIIWMARLLNIPITERVAGSDLFNALSNRKTDEPVKVFFFGGEPGVAEQANIMLNKMESGLNSVGYYDPGFVSVEKMSTESIIDEINRHDIDFLIVSLGAKKGQAWIEKNRDILNVSIVSHLGAVVNFLAGTVKRSPNWMKGIGLEWFWRIYQEPYLWKRYFDDGIQLMNLVFFSVLPYALWLRLNKAGLKINSSIVIEKQFNKEKNCINVNLSGVCKKQNNDALRQLFKQLVLDGKNVIIDLRNVPVIDGEFLALCMLLRKYLMNSGNTMELINPDGTVRKLFKWNKAQYLFQ